MHYIWAIIVLIVSTSLTTFAAVPPIKFKPHSLDKFFDEGVVIGGEAGRSFSLIEVSRKQGKVANSPAESISLSIGDENGRKITKSVGYFHVSVENEPARIVIDLSQLAYTKIDEKKLAGIFRNSRFVKSTDMTMDPEDFSTNMTFYLNKPAKVKVSSPPARGQIVINIAENIEPKKTKKNKKTKGKK